MTSNTVFYLFGILKAPALLKGIQEGLQAKTLHTYPVSGLALIYQEIDQDFIQNFDKQAVSVQKSHPGLVHHQIIQSLSQAQPLIPFAYATVVKQLDQILEMMEQRQEQFRQKIDQIDQKSEFVLKIRCTQEAQAPIQKNWRKKLNTLQNTTVSRFLYQKMKAQHAQTHLKAQQDSWFEGILHQLEPWYTDYHMELKPNYHKITFLVQWNQIDGFKSYFAQVKQQHQSMRWMLSGPWPCYHFAYLNITL